jgi:hypothetical protein
LHFHADGVEKEKQANASEGKLEQTINCFCDAQTLNQVSDFVKVPDFHFLTGQNTKLRNIKLG